MTAKKPPAATKKKAPAKKPRAKPAAKKKRTPAKKLPEPIGGGWYKLPDGSKIRGRVKAYEAAGLDPEKDGNRRSDAVKQRRRRMSIEERRTRVSALWLRKLQYREIAAALDVSIGTIQSDVEAIREAWRTERIREVGDYVLEELASLDEDERSLRLAYQSAATITERLRIYDRIHRIRIRRADLLGLDAPTVQRILTATDDAAGGEMVFVAGGNEDEFVAALDAAMGQPFDGKLRAV